jgi:hypothetical protein
MSTTAGTPPPACACCGAGLTTSGPVAYACDCTRDQWRWGLVRCLDCQRCTKHCACPEGPCRSWNEVSRRAVAGTLAHQRGRAD